MKENKRNIDEFFLSQLGNATEQPAPALWDALEKRLDDNTSSKQPRVIWWLIFLLVFVGAGAGLASYYGIINNKTQTTIIQEAKNNKVAESFNEEGLKEQAFGTEIEKETDSEKLEDFVDDANVKAKLANNTKLASTNNRVNSEHNTISNKLQKTNGSKNEPATSSNFQQKNDNSSSSQVAAESNANTNGLAEAKAKSKASKNNTSFKAANKSSELPVSSKSSRSVSNKEPLKPSSSFSDKNAYSNSNKLSSAPKGKTNNPIASTTKNKAIGNNTNANKTDAPKNQAKLVNASNKVANFETKEAENSTKNNLQKAARNAIPKEETIVFKPKKKTESPSPKAVSENRGLSGVPDDMKEEWEKEATQNKDDEEFFSTSANSQETIKDKIKKQIEQVEKIRAQNPLSGVSLAANSMEEIPSENPNTVNTQNTSGGGGQAASTKDKIKKGLNMAIGVKAGYEQGVAGYTAGKSVGSVFAEIRLSNRINFILQPTIKFARTNQQFTRQTGSYIDTGALSTNLYNTRVDTTGKPTGFYDFAYSQNYDSLVATSLTKNRFVEIEIPFLFRYKVNKNFSVLTGMNFVFGKIIETENSLKRHTGGNIRDTIFNAFGTTPPSPPSKFSYAGSNFIANYKEPTNPLAPNPVRFGYTVGLSYAIREKLMIDLIIQQNLSGGNNISDADIKKIFTQPYFRLSIGYSILGKVGK